MLGTKMHTVKVLIVDDYQAFRQFVCSILQATNDFSVVGQASDGLEAIQKADETQPDVILLDIGLPKLNGIEVAQRISVVAPRAKILFLSTISDPDVVSSTLNHGAHGYVAKSAANRDLLSALTTIAGGERFVSRELTSALA